MSRVLIIKLGYRQGLPNEVCRSISLGSVLRSTVILNLFANNEVMWVTSAAAEPLLRGIEGVGRVLIYDHLVSLGLTHEHFDVVVNLEQGLEFCILAESVKADRRFGFALDETGMTVVPLSGAERALALELSGTAKRVETRPFQQVLFEMMGKDWQGEEMLLGYTPKGKEVYDVGLSMSVGGHWPLKAWPVERWEELNGLIAGRYSVSHEPHPVGLKGYTEWLNSCRIVVSGDTLGLYLALALGKGVVGLFGPTSAARCHTYGRGIVLTPEVKLNCIPCCDTECQYGRSCVDTISPERVAGAIDMLDRAGIVDV